MLAINMDDVINVLNSCKPYLIALGIALAIAIIVTVDHFFGFAHIFEQLTYMSSI